ncbi:HNH endonuclease signature motif containing protein [Gordonia sp. VNQ95]|uniref:HNH endonuclease signature motif containing protein n=1 Tax=Gordonia sp. VNQ95 TaxID=3156619 RepID=UPI0032B52A03
MACRCPACEEERDTSAQASTQAEAAEDFAEPAAEAKGAAHAADVDGGDCAGDATDADSCSAAAADGQFDSGVAADDSRGADQDDGTVADTAVEPADSTDEGVGGDPTDPATPVDPPAVTDADSASHCSCTCAEHRSPPPPPVPVPVPAATIFVVANQSTLDGEDDEPGYLDGFGVIDADSVRDLDNREFTRRVGVSRELAMQGLDGWKYRPGKRTQAYIRAGEPCCTWPGCNAPVSTTDLDHKIPFDHKHPERGGPTAVWNLGPLCRFHHRHKTFGRWRDFQDSLMRAFFQSPSGHWFEGNAFRGSDMFPGLAVLAPKPPDHPARRAIDTRYAHARDEADDAADRAERNDPPPF